MGKPQRIRDIETLARIAARLAGRDPDEYLKLELGNSIAFDGSLWQYPDFVARAEAAYHELNTYCDPLTPAGEERR